MFHVDLDAVRAAFDEQMRRNPVPGPNARVERDERITRMVDVGGVWAAVVWSDLTEADADDVVAAEVARFADAEFFEWKHYSGDRPSDLPARLAAAGLVADPPETVLVADLRELDLPVSPPDGVRIEPVEGRPGVEAMLEVHQEVFGEVHPGTREAVEEALTQRPRPIQAVVAYAGDLPVSAARVEFSEGTQFASLWGGGTLREWRGRGIFRALVAHRALLAQERGFRYLQVDAMPTSRPILERLGFVALAETTPWVREKAPAES